MKTRWGEREMGRMRQSVGQATTRAPRFDKIANEIKKQPEVFGRQGAVVASWRYYRGKRLGPYFRVAYRVEGHQQSIYLGRRSARVRKVRRLLAKAQRPYKEYREKRRRRRKFDAYLRARLRELRREIQREMLRMGLEPRGLDCRGFRRLDRVMRWASLAREAGIPVIQSGRWGERERGSGRTAEGSGNPAAENKIWQIGELVDQRRAEVTG